tara:strand:- start:27 stop:383 length:357 start_codon:yes stop_codon:yes gene_type:complete
MKQFHKSTKGVKIMKHKQPTEITFTLLPTDIGRLQLMLESAQTEGVEISWIEYKVSSDVGKDKNSCHVWATDSTKTKVIADRKFDDSEVTHYYEFEKGEDHICSRKSLVKLTQTYNKQ